MKRPWLSRGCTIAVGPGATALPGAALVAEDGASLRQLDSAVRGFSSRPASPGDGRKRSERVLDASGGGRTCGGIDAEPGVVGVVVLYREVLERDFGWLDNVVGAKKPKHLPVVFAPEEAMGVIEELPHYAELSIMRIMPSSRLCARQRRAPHFVSDGRGFAMRIISVRPELHQGLGGGSSLLRDVWWLQV